MKSLFTFFLSLFFATLLFHSSIAFAQVSEEWVVRHDDGGGSYVITDEEGNIYVTGASKGITGISYDKSDYLTSKFNNSGELQWVARYNGPRSDMDQPSAIAVDREGNVYVTGRSFGSRSNLDYATIKYNASGEEQWIRRQIGGGFSIAVDAAGNVYVGGDTSTEGGEDFTVIKYNTAGEQQWLSRYNGPANDHDLVTTMVVDADGNSYITGISNGLDNGHDIATVKFNNLGEQQWVARYNESLYDDVKSIVVDGDGNVLIIGGSRHEEEPKNYTIKYDASGLQQWVKHFTGSGTGNSGISGLALDSGGNVYVTGPSEGNGTGADFTTIKYNPSGVQQWMVKFNGPANGKDVPYAVGLDAEDNVFVAGYSMGKNEENQFTIVKYTQQLNTTPTAVDDAFSTNEGVRLRVEAPGVLANDTDGDENSLTAVLVAGPANGELALAADGAFTYTPMADFSGSDSFSYKTSDGTGYSNTATVTITVNPVNVPPVLSLPALPASVGELSNFTFTASATDEDNDELIFSLNEAPEEAMIDPSTGVFSWTPAEAQGDGSSYSFTVEVSDGILTSTESFSLVVNEVNSAPDLVTIPDQAGDELKLISFTATASDLDLPANSLSYQLLNAPEGASIDAGTGVFSWVPGEGQDGIHSVTVKVTDSGDPAMSAEQVVAVRVNEVNIAPVLEPLGDATTSCGNPVSFRATASDADIVGGGVNSLSFSLEGVVPQGAAIEEGTGEFSWSPSSEKLGSHEITIRVSDNGSPVLYDEQTFTVTLEDEVPPTVEARQLSVQLNARGTASITAAEVNNGSSDNCTPAEELIMQLDKTSFSCDEVGQNTLRVTVEDASGNRAFSEVIVVVEDTIKPEVVAKEVSLMLDASGNGSLSVDEVDNGSSDNCSISSLTLDKDSFSCEELGEDTVTLTATDASGNTASATAIVRVKDAMPPIARTRDLTIYLDGDQASLTAEQLDGGSSDNCGIARLAVDKTSFTCENIGVNTVSLTVTDVNGNQATGIATITVEDNLAPVVDAGQEFAVDEKSTRGTIVGKIAANDNCAIRSISISAGNMGNAFAIDAAGTITVQEAAALDYETTPEFMLTVAVDDAAGNVGSKAISIKLNNINDDAPVIAFLPDMVGYEMSMISFRAIATAEDEAAGELRFSLGEGAPEGASIDAITGEFTWIPTEAQGPAFYSITVIVSDGTLTDSEELKIAVDEVNQAPVFISEPVLTAGIGEPYIYKLEAADSDLPANTLTYEALKIPGWLSFDEATQTLSGTPAKTAAGKSQVRLRVSDGKKSATQEFTLTVEPPTGMQDRNKPDENVTLVYPNPTTGKLKIRMDEVPEEEIIEVTLLNLEGKLLLQEKGSLKDGEERLSAHLVIVQAGVYLLQLKAKGSVRYLKVVKE